MAEEFKIAVSAEGAKEAAAAVAAMAEKLKAAKEAETAAAVASRQAAQIQQAGADAKLKAAQEAEDAALKEMAAAEKSVDVARKRTVAETQQAAASSKAGYATLMLAQSVDDLQYGVRGVLNNIPGLLASLGAGAGMAGVVSIAAVGLTVLVSALSKMGDSAAEAAAESLRLAQNQSDLARRVTAAAREIEEASRIEAEANEWATSTIDNKITVYEREIKALQRVSKAQREKDSIEMELLRARKEAALQDVDSGALPATEKIKQRAAIEQQAASEETRIKAAALKRDEEQALETIRKKQQTVAALEDKATRQNLEEKAKKEAEAQARKLQLEADGARDRAISMLRQAERLAPRAANEKFDAGKADPAAVLNEALRVIQTQSPQIQGNLPGDILGERSRQADLPSLIEAAKQRAATADKAAKSEGNAMEARQQAKDEIKDLTVQVELLKQKQAALKEIADLDQRKAASRTNQDVSAVEEKEAEQKRRDQARQEAREKRAEAARHSVAKGADDLASQGNLDPQFASRLHNASMAFERGNEKAWPEVVRLLTMLIAAAEKGRAADGKQLAEINALKRQMSNTRADDTSGQE